MGNEVIKIAATATDGSLYLKPNLYTALRKGPNFSTDDLIGTEIKYGNYQFNVTQTNFYKLWVGTNPSDTTEFISFGGTGEGRYIIADEDYVSITAQLQNQIYTISSSLTSYTLNTIFVSATSDLQNQINALSSMSGSFVFSNLDGGFANTIYGGTTSFDAGGAI